MPETITGMLVDLVTHAGHSGIDLGTEHVRRRMFGPTLPTLPTMPTPPALPRLGDVASSGSAMPIPRPPELPRLAWPGSTGEPSAGNGHLRSAAGRDAPLAVPVVAGATAAAGVSLAVETEAFSYSDEVAAGTACANCLRKHLGAARGAARAAAESARAGDSDQARLHLARAAAEISVLKRYDLTPEKIAATPAAHRAPIERTLPCVEDLARQFPTPADVATAWGAADEAIRFARSTAPTDRDRAEISLRLQDVDAFAAVTERLWLGPENVDQLLATLPPEQHAEARGARDQLRAAGHVLDRGDPTAAATLEEASGHLARAAAALTPAPTVQQAEAIAEACDSCQKEFYRAYLGTRSGVPA